ncbi:MAG TPA: GNAT family N-acetyltransferase, partial [Caulobacteraceae bacterium]
MPQPRLSAEIMGWEALPAEARAAWPRLRALGGLEHPFFDLRYLDAAAQVAPHAQVAVLTEAGRGLAGLLPFQRRGGLIQPLGAPLSDYHGLLGDADPGQALAAVVRASGAQAFRFTGLRARQAPRGARQAHPSMVRDLGDGAPLILGPTAESAARAAKNLRRAERALERDVGPITFEWGPADARTIERVIRRKRLQYRRSGRHDVFACGWTAELLHLLARTGDAEFGLRAAVLRAGGRPVAAELGLLGAGAYHLWFPVYSRTLARYAPGMLMTLRTMEALR